MISQKTNLKILMVNDALGFGGAEKVHAILSLYFEKNGFCIEHLIVHDKISYTFAGKMNNMGIFDKQKFSVIRKWMKYKMFKNTVSKNFDFIIDFRMKQNFLLESFISSVFYRKKSTIYRIESYNLHYYFPTFLGIIPFGFSDKKFISVSNEIRNIMNIKYPNLQNKLIYNPIDLEDIDSKKKEIETNDKYIFFIGRLNDQVKQVDKLIECYAGSDLPKKGIKLYIAGNGKNQKIMDLISKHNITNEVVLLGYLENPFPYYKNAIFTILCSKFEGFPNVIIESLACDTPVISFDCQSGPSEILNGKNGILVENQNWVELKNAMNLLINDQKKYQKLKSNCLESIQKFSAENIGKQWLDLFSKMKK